MLSRPFIPGSIPGPQMFRGLSRTIVGSPGLLRTTCFSRFASTAAFGGNPSRPGPATGASAHLQLLVSRFPASQTTFRAVPGRRGFSSVSADSKKSDSETQVDKERDESDSESVATAADGQEKQERKVEYAPDGMEYASPEAVRGVLNTLGAQVIWHPQMLLDALEEDDLRLNPKDLWVKPDGGPLDLFVSRVNLALFWDPLALLLMMPISDFVLLGALMGVGSFFQPGIALPLAHGIQKLLRRFLLPVLAVGAGALQRLVPHLQSHLLFAEMKEHMPAAMNRMLEFASRFGLVGIMIRPVIAVSLTFVLWLALTYLVKEDPLELFRMLGLPVPESVESLVNKYSGVAAAASLFGLFAPLNWLVMPWMAMRFVRPVTAALRAETNRVRAEQARAAAAKEMRRQRRRSRK